MDFLACGTETIHLYYLPKKQILPKELAKLLYTLQPMKLIADNITDIINQLEFLEGLVI